MSKFTFPMPKKYPKSFKGVRKELSLIVDQMSEYREKNPKTLTDFFSEFENMYFDSMNVKGEQQNIRHITLYLVWCQMMALIKEELKDE